MLHCNVAKCKKATVLLKFINVFPLGVKLQFSQSMTSLLLLMIVCECCKVQV